MIEENELRGSLVTSNEATGTLGFKGERGYSAYEIAVQHGFEGTEEDWLATLGTSSHFSKDVAVYTTTETTTEFNTPITVATGDFVDVYVNGFKLNENEYTFNTTKVTLTNAILSGNTVEVIVNRMSTNNLPISETISASSTNDTAAGTKAVYDFVNPIKTYSTTEQIIGTWIDGKPIYRKTINFGALPNNTTKSINHNINNLDYVTDIKGIAYNSTSGLYVPLPHVNVFDVNYGLEIYMDNTKVYLLTASDMSAYNNTYITIEYTKTTD